MEKNNILKIIKKIMLNEKFEQYEFENNKKIIILDGLAEFYNFHTNFYDEKIRFLEKDEKLLKSNIDSLKKIYSNFQENAKNDTNKYILEKVKTKKYSEIRNIQEKIEKNYDKLDIIFNEKNRIIKKKNSERKKYLLLKSNNNYLFDKEKSNFEKINMVKVELKSKEDELKNFIFSEINLNSTEEQINCLKSIHKYIKQDEFKKAENLLIGWF